MKLSTAVVCFLLSIGLTLSCSVYGYKEVGFLAVGYLGALVQGYEHVGFAGIYHRHVGTIALHIASESERYAEVDVLFYRFASGRSGVLSAVSGVDAKRELAVGTGYSRYKRYNENC